MANPKPTFSKAEKIKALKREVLMREVVYPRKVRDNTMTQKEVDYQIAIMRAILEDAERGDDRLTHVAAFLDGLANRLDSWARESKSGGWSTHQVEANTRAADDCRRAASGLRPSEHCGLNPQEDDHARA